VGEGLGEWVVIITPPFKAGLLILNSFGVKISN
jgi:hypothetical protein